VQHDDVEVVVRRPERSSIPLLEHCPRYTGGELASLGDEHR
jgi:hypothetical protein